MYNQFFTIKPRISEKNGGSKVVHLITLRDTFRRFMQYLVGVLFFDMLMRIH